MKTRKQTTKRQPYDTQDEIELELDDGRKTTIGKHGVIIQRGTNHLWRNTSDKVCRMAFILIEAPAYLHNGQPLEEYKPEQVDSRYEGHRIP